MPDGRSDLNADVIVTIALLAADPIAADCCSNYGHDLSNS
jgi:hypothetical protein